jgi:hypothetical protein
LSFTFRAERFLLCKGHWNRYRYCVEHWEPPDWLIYSTL